MKTDSTAILIAGIALGVSGATFLWRIVYDIYFDAPRTRVTLTKGGIGQPPQFIDVYMVTATNKGKRPTTLDSLWLCVGRPGPRWLGRILPTRLWRRFFDLAIIVPGERLTAMMPGLPKRLEPGDYATIYYAQDDVATSLVDKLPARLFGRAWTTHGRRTSGRIGLKPSS